MQHNGDKILRGFLLGLTLLVNTIILGQNPHYFLYDDENGLPSNEIYSLVQDQRGFMWFGCDAGLYRYDGIRYQRYECASQNSKSISGLSISSSGRLYCCNFQSQIFYHEQGQLRELPYTYPPILHLACDQSGNVIVNHQKGIVIYNESTKTWKDYSTQLGQPDTPTRSVRVNKKNEISFLTQNGIALLRDSSIQFVLTKDQKYPRFSSDHVMECWHDERWVFPIYGTNPIYKTSLNELVIVENTRLSELLKDKRITNVKSLSDDCLWICTYNGIIRFDPASGSPTLFYPEFSFSDCMIDREGNYWFSTLQSGLIRVPNLEHLIWANEGNYKITHITGNDGFVFASTVNGAILKLNVKTNELSMANAGLKTDVQCLNYVKEDSLIYFFANKELFSIDKKGNTQKILSPSAPIKFICRVGKLHLLCSSMGAWLYDLDQKEAKLTLTSNWSRQAIFEEKTSTLWIASNKGLLKYAVNGDSIELTNTFLESTQILSIDHDSLNGILYVLTFDGKLFVCSSNTEPQIIGALPNKIQSHTIAYHDGNLFITSNKGISIFSPTQKTYRTINSLSGLASNNVQGLIILNQYAWLATGKGIQKMELSETTIPPRSLVYLKNQEALEKPLVLNYNQSLILYPEASCYSSNGKFRYAYRILNADSSWVQLPSSIESIDIQNIPTGEFELELKTIDHLGRDSENTILLKGYVNPPIWRTMWFIVLMIVAFLVVVYSIFKQQWSKRQKQLQLQNELNTLKLTAIQSQMNPHFIFNALNSIQDLVLKGDVENSYSYITTFSNLVRLTLTYSDKELIDFEQEIKLLRLYLSLEQLRFKKELEFTIETKDITDIQIPPMLIQPFIENALVHGLLHKEGSKKIEIRFVLGENLICEVTDNGIGREAALKISKRQHKQHDSFAVKAIQKRFEILGKHYGEKLGFYYEDLSDNGMSTGTRVILSIPVKRKF